MLSLLIAAALASDAAEPYHRNRAEVAAFKRANPCPAPDADGGCSAYVVDHIIPICACAGDTRCLRQLDHRANMQWQRYGRKPGESLFKDLYEKAACAAIRRRLAAEGCAFIDDEEPTEKPPAPKDPVR